MVDIVIVIIVVMQSNVYTDTCVSDINYFDLFLVSFFLSKEVYFSKRFANWRLNVVFENVESFCIEKKNMERWGACIPAYVKYEKFSLKH